MTFDGLEKPGFPHFGRQRQGSLIRHLTLSSYRGRLGAAFRRVLAAAFVSGLLAQGSWAQTPGLYRIDPQASHIEIRVYRSGFFSAMGDNHQIALRKFSGTAEGDPKRGWTVKVEAEAWSLEVLDPEASPSTRAEIQRTMLGPTQMDVERFPAIGLRADSSRPGAAPQSLILVADLNLHGVTRRIEFPMAWSEEGEVIRAFGKTSLRLRDFNIEPISKGLGTVKVRNEFDIEFNMVLRRESSSPAQQKR